jgi:filamentous hemagglutinin
LGYVQYGTEPYASVAGQYGLVRAARLGLSVGQGLSAAQQAALTFDIIWYQKEVVEVRTVLVPQLYLAPGHEALAGASISAKNVFITGGTISNVGSIAAQDRLSLTSTSGNVTNTDFGVW